MGLSARHRRGGFFIGYMRNVLKTYTHMHTISYILVYIHFIYWNVIWQEDLVEDAAVIFSHSWATTTRRSYRICRTKRSNALSASLISCAHNWFITLSVLCFVINIKTVKKCHFKICCSTAAQVFIEIGRTPIYSYLLSLSIWLLYRNINICFPHTLWV